MRADAPADDTRLTHILQIQQDSLADGHPNRVLRLWHMQGLKSSGWGENYANTNAALTTDAWVYLRLRHEGRVGAVYGMSFDVSLDGLVWETQRLTFIAAPVYVGLVMWNFNTSGQVGVEGLVDFFRYIPACVNANEPVFGRWIGSQLASSANVVSDVVSFDTTTLFPLLMGDVKAGEHIHACTVLIDTPFDGTVSLTVGEPGAVDRLIAAAQVDPYEVGQYVNTPEYTYPGAASLHLYLTHSGCTQGAGRIILIRKESYRG